MWNGISATGKPLSMTESQMAAWARDNDKVFQVGWSNSYEFGRDEVSNPTLKGARFVRLDGSGGTYADAAETAGWPDLAALFREAGL